MIGLRCLFAGILLATTGVPALGQTTDAAAEEPTLDVSANLGVVSDYRFRGVSLSDRGPALQGGLDLEGEHFFVGGWASTIADYAGADVELDLYAGLHGASERFGWTTGAYAYIYPNGDAVNYVELMASGETYVGPLTLGVEAAWAPPQDNLDATNRYAGATASFETSLGVALHARGGYEDGFYDHKWDWELGASYTRGPFTASLAYVDTASVPDEEDGLGKAGVVASLLATF